MKDLTAEQREQFDRWHDSGEMPDWAYYQQVNVPWYLSIPAQKKKFMEEAEARQAQIQEAKEQQRREAEQKKALEEEASKIAVKAFEDVFKGYLKG